MKIIFWWDTEDYINPESDDALLLLLGEFRKRRIPAVFKMVGEKTRCLVERNRRDIIDALKDDLFEIGYHTNLHSAHPTIAEYTEHLDWQDGVAEILSRETEGFRLTRDTFGKEIVCYGQPGASYTPFVYGAMKAWGVPAYMGGSVYLGDDVYPSQLGGVFNIAGLWKSRASFDARAGDGALETAWANVSRLAEKLPPDGIISHGNHPNEWSLEEFWDVVNFAHGACPVPDDWKPAPLVPADVMAHRVGTFGRYLDRILEHGIEPVGIRQAMASFSTGTDKVNTSVIKELAAAWAGGSVDSYLDDRSGTTLSAAQILVLLAQAATSNSRDTFCVPAVDAPVHIEAVPGSGGTSLARETLLAAASGLVDHVEHSGTLPAAIAIPGGPGIRPAQLGVALARFTCGGGDSIAVDKVDFIPSRAVKVYGRDIGPWLIHHDAFTGENLHRYTCLLAWSYRRLLGGDGR
ncbi:MAG: hypothetical protein JW909_13360 [Planctomycetes bacterium]|nr:hypothetical protein [Planctomycetota bacterium]